VLRGGLAVLVLAALGIAFGALALVLAVGEEHRLLTVCIIAAVFLAAAAMLAWSLRRFAAIKPRAFDSTLAKRRRQSAPLQCGCREVNRPAYFPGNFSAPG
jgi:uncharacterized membrane protein YqjE